MKTLQELKDKMESNGYSYFDREAFNNEPDKVCYIPEGAKEVDDAFTRNDLNGLCEDFSKEKDFSKIDVEKLTLIMFLQLEWSFPSTWLLEFGEDLDECED